MTSQHIEDDQLEAICKTLELTKAEAVFMGEYHPTYYVGRLIDLGFKRKDAYEIGKYYEEYVFAPIMEIYKNMKKTVGGNE